MGQSLDFPLTYSFICDIIITIFENYPLIRSCEVGKAVSSIVTITIAISVPVCRPQAGIFRILRS